MASARLLPLPPQAGAAWSPPTLPPAPQPRRAGRSFAWAGSAALHLLAGTALFLAVPTRPPEPLPVMLLEMPAPEPLPEPAQEMVAETPAAEPARPEPPPPPVEAMPEPSTPAAEAAPPEPEPPRVETREPEPPETVADALPLPPPPPPVPVPPQPRRPPPQPRLAPAQAQPAAQPAPPAAVAAPAAPAGPPAVSPNAAPARGAAPSPNYVAQLFAALERHKTYPPEARSRRVQGVAMLRFRMRRDGTVVGYRVERSAGDASLDDAVVAMIQRASPLPAPPADLPGDPIELTVPVRFALR
ncbi:energy transducer TonB [Roseicella aquatilis]|uniref:Energy transducer TonB n=1 Tax=Roseicella aquatilis TaxID=2527868 RepID=A0A4R4DSS3_9PROT|nr:energy transducer TonB [Roseicella aquatilis]TCZ65551.1 energy transducer TonB [Roseicella aquatilis]